MRLYIRELGEVSDVEVQPLRQPLHQVRALVTGEGAGERGGRNTQRQLGVITCTGPYPYETHAAIQPLKCFFFFSFSFREILPQFIPTNGSLHTSKSYGCLNGCSAHTYTLADRHTHTHTRRAHKHKQTHKEPCQGKRDQLPLQAW